MPKPDFKEFAELTRQGYLVPVYKEYLMDMDSPVSVLNRFAEDEDVFLLESVEGGERRGRYSFLGVEPYARFTVENGVPYFIENGKRRALEIPEGGPLTALRETVFQQKVFEFPELPKFIGGAIGYIGYNTVREFERLPEKKEDLPVCTTCMMLTDCLIIFDNVLHKVKIVCCARQKDGDSIEALYKQACESIERIGARMKKPLPCRYEESRSKFDKNAVSSNMTKGGLYGNS